MIGSSRKVTDHTGWVFPISEAERSRSSLGAPFGDRSGSRLLQRKTSKELLDEEDGSRKDFSGEEESCGDT